jgi:hypothetical protein
MLQQTPTQQTLYPVVYPQWVPVVQQPVPPAMAPQPPKDLSINGEPNKVVDPEKQPLLAKQPSQPQPAVQTVFVPVFAPIYSTFLLRRFIDIS